MRLFALTADEYEAGNASLGRVALLLSIGTLIYPPVLVLAIGLHDGVAGHKWGRSADAFEALSLLISTFVSGASLILVFRGTKRRVVAVIVGGLATIVNLLAFLSAAISD